MVEQPILANKRIDDLDVNDRVLQTISIMRVIYNLSKDDEQESEWDKRKFVTIEQAYNRQKESFLIPKEIVKEIMVKMWSLGGVFALGDIHDSEFLSVKFWT